jgi:hypothetical protein
MLRPNKKGPLSRIVQRLRLYSGADPTPQPDNSRPEPAKPDGSGRKRKRRRRPSFRRVYQRYVLPSLQEKNRSATKTIADIELHLARWYEFWNEQRIIYPLLVTKVKRENLEEWRRHLSTATKYNRGKPLAARTVNKHLASLRQILVAAEKHEIIGTRPRVEQLRHRKAAAKHYMTDEQIDRLWVAADKLNWPSTNQLPARDWWRAALILWRTYGFRTQELIAYEASAAEFCLCWSAVSLDEETPNPEGTAKNKWGWMVYVPRKQSWAKPEPLYLPLTKHTRAVIDRLGNLERSAYPLLASQAEQAAKLTGPLLPCPRAASRFYAMWSAWLSIADVRPKTDGATYDPKSLRKTCATMLDRHAKSLAEAVVGWGERTGSSVAQTHYIADELWLVDQLTTAPMPSSFDAWLS